MSDGDRPVGEDDQHQRMAEAVDQAVHRHLGEHLARMEQVLAAHVHDGVTAGRNRIGQSMHELPPAWRRATVGEQRWPVVLAVLTAIGLQFAVPARFALAPPWLLPGLEFALLAAITAANPNRITGQRPWLRPASLVLVAVASLANVYSAVRLIARLVGGGEGTSAGPLLAVGAAIWLTNIIVFALWYWEFDRGGPAARAHGTADYPDFQFPQMTSPTTADPDWEPGFVDYLYLSFTNATAFSPTDTLPMTHWAKLTMLTQSAVSLATVALVIARAVNILN